MKLSKIIEKINENSELDSSCTIDVNKDGTCIASYFYLEPNGRTVKKVVKYKLLIMDVYIEKANDFVQPKDGRIYYYKTLIKDCVNLISHYINIYSYKELT